MVCGAAIAGDARVRAAAFETLHAVALSYYRHLVPYMQELFNITVNAMRKDTPDVQLQARCLQRSVVKGRIVC